MTRLRIAPEAEEELAAAAERYESQRPLSTLRLATLSALDMRSRATQQYDRFA